MPRCGPDQAGKIDHDGHYQPYPWRKGKTMAAEVWLKVGEVARVAEKWG
jgi:hypothetical protein